MDNKSEVIAIDGPAASGKSTIAGLLAEKLNIAYINTGNMYRALTLKALNEGIFLSDNSLDRKKLAVMLENTDLAYNNDQSGRKVLFLDGRNIEGFIRTPEVSEKVSILAAEEEVRKWLVAIQRSYAADGMLVMEGRDIGTVVFPDAAYKFFLTASPEIRARRRLEQKGEVYDGATLDSVAASIAERDKMDMNREISPLKCADDAMKIDTSDLDIQDVVEKIIALIEKKQNRN
jgi:cytidylate kinase